MFLKTDGAGNLSFDTVGGSTTPFAVIGNATAGSEIRLPEDTDNGSNYVAIKAPDTIASNLTLTLPSADGSSGQVLQTNGSGVLSFAGVSASAGQVIQVVSATDNTQRTTTSTSYVTASNTLSVSITPSSASNKILILTAVNIQAENNDCQWTIFKDGSNLTGANGFKVAYNGAVGARDQFSTCYLDSPATTSATTYQVYFKSAGGASYTAYVNVANCLSSITVMEIKG